MYRLNQNFKKATKIIHEPKPHPMCVLEFHSTNPEKNKDENEWEIYYEEVLPTDEENVLLEGIIKEAQKAKEMGE